MTLLPDDKLWSVEEASCLAFLDGLPAKSVSLVLGSPPYEKARTYGIDFNLSGQEWVDWMVAVCQASLRVCTGLVAFVVEGQTKQFRYSATPALLMADLHRAGVCLRKPPIFHRVGIPGSGGPDWLRNDYEFIICATSGGKLPWSDNTACGHPPKWAPGGEMSHRLSDGARVNQWGPVGGKRGGGGRRTDGTLKPSKLRVSEGKATYPSHQVTKTTARGHANGDLVTGEYAPPVLANPGNVIVEDASSLVSCNVGGGVMGNALCSENEAPYPEDLAAFFVRSFCPPGGIVLDCFSGSGTTAAVAVREGRRFVGCDIRASQVELTKLRVSGETPPLFV